MPDDKRATLDDGDSAVILQPGSLTNSSDRYLVVSYTSWVKYADSEQRTKLREFGRYDSSADAHAAADALNGKGSDDV